MGSWLSFEYMVTQAPFMVLCIQHKYSEYYNYVKKYWHQQ